MSDIDISPEYLEKMKKTYYKAHILVDIDMRENMTRNQSTAADSNAQELWYGERRKRITASTVGGIAKMRESTKRANKAEHMLYTKFRGNASTKFGIANELVSREEYVTYMHQHGHTDLALFSSGLIILSDEMPWLAASPDGRVVDPTCTDSQGL